MPRRVAVPRRLVMALVAAATCGPLLGCRIAVAGDCGCRGMLADEFDAADAGLVREWIVQVPFDPSTARLVDVVAGDGLALARSENGGVHAIRAAGAAAGTIAWTRTLDAAAGTGWAPTLGPGLVLVTGDRAIHALDRETGAVAWERPSGGDTAAAAVQAGDWVYVPLVNQRILRLPANPLAQASAPRPAPNAGGRTPAATAVARERLDPVSLDAGGVPAVSPELLGDAVLWATDGGFVALEPTPLGWIRHELPDSRESSSGRRVPLDFVGRPVVRGNAIVFATRGGSLGRVDFNAEDRPGLRTSWSVTLPDQPASCPLVSDAVIVVSLGPSGIAAYAAADGRGLWWTHLVGTPVAIAGGRVWVIDELNRLTALDLATGSRRQSYCLGCFTLPVVNDRSERLLLASPGGVVVSLAAPAPPAPLPAPVSGEDSPPPPAVEDPDTTPP